MKKRILASLLCTVLTAGLLTACSGESEENDKNSPDNKNSSVQEEERELTKVTLNEVAHSIFYAPMYVAIEEGYFEEEGIELDLVCGFGENTLGKDTLEKPRICVKKKQINFWHFAQRFFVKFHNKMIQYSAPELMPRGCCYHSMLYKK